MSRLPNVSYDYSEADYYYQDSSRSCYQEGYVEQLVFNPCEQNPNHLTEIYRRPTTNHVEPRYCHPNYDYPEYYYDNQQPVYDPKSGQYYVMPSPELHYRPSRLYADVQRPMQTASGKQPIKRYPITVKTPRFYKRPNQQNLYKRPSTLCLPVISQPDPATSMRRYKKTHNQEQEKNYRLHESPSNHKMDSEGDTKLTHLEKLLSKYEKESRLDNLNVNSKSDLAKLAKTLKPRVPSSVKMRQERQKLKVFQNYDIQEIPRTILSSTSDGVKLAPDALDKLLLKLKKCEVGGEKKPPETQEEKPLEDEDSPPLKSKSYNYQEISDQFKKSQISNLRTTASSISNDSARSEIEELPSTSTNPTKLGPKMLSLDDNCALELHRSKSYIVNLIDRALSKELGTVPCDRLQKSKFDSMNPKRAIELVNRHSYIKNEDSENLQQSIVGCNGVASSTKNCNCKEEPDYIKQLKQLRWGHLKHIQREVRRLEDLERFLDACTEGNEDTES